VKLRCLIVDDSSSFLEAAQALLEREGLSVVGVASSGGDALRSAQELRPDVVLVDISLRGESGFEVARRLVDHEDDRVSAVILISTHSESDFADLIESSPAIGFLPKSELSADAIRRMVNGRSR
jgi:DNA-binding NarL/FixJ family response regulator